MGRASCVPDSRRCRAEARAPCGFHRSGGPDRPGKPVFSLPVAAVTFGVVFLAELPDKTALAGLMLGTSYRASYVFAGVATAFAIHVAIAIAAGQVLTL